MTLPSLQLTNGRLEVTVDLLVAGAILHQVVLATILGIEALGTDLSVLRPLVVVLYLTFVPGVLLVALIEIETTVTTAILYAIGLSFITIMLLGATTSVLAPLVGIERPLDQFPLAITMLMATLTLSIGVLIRRPSFRYSLPIRGALDIGPLALLLLPFGSILGTILIETAGTNVPLLIVLGTISLLPLAVVLLRREHQWHGLLIWSLSAALVYHGRMWPFTAGHQLSQITVEQGRWIPNYAGGLGSLLPNGVLYPTYAVLADIPVAMEFELVNPFLMSFIPVMLYELFRRQMDAVTALLGASFFAFSFPFYTLYPIGGRIATPVFFLALLGITIVDKEPERITAGGLALLFGAGIAVSHYGTAWVVMFALFVSSGVYVGIQMADLLRSEAGLKSAKSAIARALGRHESDVAPVRLSPAFMGFYSTIALGWYLYTGLGGKFQALPNHVKIGLTAVLYRNGIVGAATRSATKNYGSISVSISRWLYILFGALMVLGITLVLWRRVVDRERPLSDEYVAIATGFLVILGAAFLPFSTGFNTARIIMIIFIFTAPFTVLGLKEIVARIGPYLPDVRTIFSRVGQATPAASLSVLLAVFLLVNTGVVSATITNDYAPKNAPLQEQLLESSDPIERSKAINCIRCIIRLHVWILDHRSPNRHIIRL